MIDDRFPINSRRGIFVEPGRYEFNEYFVLANTNAAAPFSMNLRYGNGEFYDGYRRNYTIGGTFRMNEHFNVSLSDQINDIELASGAFVTHLVTGPRQLLLQHQGVRERAGAVQHRHAASGARTSRLDIIHRPLSDIYLVYNERHDSRSGALISRAVIAKMTYLLAF